MEEGFYWVQKDGRSEVAYHLGNGNWQIVGGDGLYGIHDFQVIGPAIRAERSKLHGEENRTS